MRSCNEEARDIWMYGLEKAGESYKSGKSRVGDTNKYQLNQFGFEEYTDKEKGWWKNNDTIILCYSKTGHN